MGRHQHRMARKWGSRWQARHNAEAQRFSDARGNVLEVGDIVRARSTFDKYGPADWVTDEIRVVDLLVVDRARRNVVVTRPGSTRRFWVPANTLELAERSREHTQWGQR